MQSWKTFFEAKEKLVKKDLDKEIEDKEEELGVDLDGDNEEDESVAHKKKVMGNDCKCAKKK